MIYRALLKRKERLLALAFAAAGVIVFQYLRGPQPFDDAFITFRYARSLASGAGFVYNLGEPVQGTTTPLYTLILTALALIFGADRLPSISFGIAVAADIASVFLLYGIARHVLNDRFLAVLLSACFLLHPLRLVVAAGGMETSLFTAVLLWMYHAYLVRRQPVLTAIVAALAIWLRPDAVLAVFPVLLFTAWKNWRQSLRMGIIITLILLPWLVFATLYFGSPIPQSIQAKHVFYAGSYLTFTYYFLWAFLATGTLGIYPSMAVLYAGFIANVFLLASGLLTYLRRLDPALVLVVYPILYYLVMMQQRAPMFFIWYYIPLLPGFLLLIWTALQQLVTRLPARLWNPAYIAAAIVLVAVPTLYTYTYPDWTLVREAESAFRAASLQVKTQVQDQQVVFAPDIGVIGWELEHAYILDSVGLVSPQIVSYYAAIDDYDRMNPSAVQHFRPDFIIAHHPLFERLLSDPSFAQHYQLIWPETHGQAFVSVYARKP
jgi:hypothetical protein